MTNQTEHSIGIISDTHGLLRPEAVDALRGVETILHAGDVGDPAILESLRSIAPVIAVRGNIDKGGWAEELAIYEMVDVGGVSIYMLHDLNQLDIDPLAAGVRVVVSGHSHKPVIDDRDGVLYVNPGSAGPRRFTLPITLAQLRVDGERVAAELIELLRG